MNAVSTNRGKNERARKKKQRAWRFGRAAETMCAMWLRLKGYRILARGFRVNVGEIDIVALRRGVLVFVEVKARRDGGNDDGLEAVLSPRQRHRIARAAEAFLKLNPNLSELSMRFDLIVVGRGRWPRHHKAAWRSDD